MIDYIIQLALIICATYIACFTIAAILITIVSIVITISVCLSINNIIKTIHANEKPRLFK